MVCLAASFIILLYTYSYCSGTVSMFEFLRYASAWSNLFLLSIAQLHKRHVSGVCVYEKYLYWLLDKKTFHVCKCI